ncbi:GTP-binding protein [Frigoribacterium salinisoli]
MSSSSPAPMSLPQADGVAVTLVAGAHAVDVSAVAAAVRGPRADLLHSGQLELVEGGEAVVDARRLDPRRRARVDAHLVADAVAEHVASLLDEGRRRGVVVEVPVTADARSVALLTGRLLEDVVAEHDPGRAVEHATQRTAGLRHVVSVVRAAELADLVLGRRDDSFLEAERVADLVEHATVVVLTGLAGLPSDERDLVVELVHRLAPCALVLDAGVVLSGASLPERGDVPGLASAAGWMRELSGAGGLPLVGATVRTWTFRDPRPFHTERLALAVDVDLVPERVGRVLRSKGFVHLATRPDRIGGWSSVGALLSLDPSVLRAFEADAPLGQELVFYGTDLRVDVLEEVLASCLLTPAELLAGPEAWRTGADPFPRWPGE